MRLLMHNMLQCPRTGGYPLELRVEKAEIVEVEFDAEFILRMINRLDWKVFRVAAGPLTEIDLPVSAPDANCSENVLRSVHKALLEWHVLEGRLVAPDGRAYIIKDGIPNLIIANAEEQVVAKGSAAASSGAAQDARARMEEEEEDDNDE